MAAPVAISSGIIPAKIVMKGTSRMSLNERFSGISAKVEEQQKKANDALLSYEQTNGVQFLSNRVSSANRRLARQMEGRPAVRAALRSRQKSVKQRLGAKARLGGVGFNNVTPNGFLPRFGFGRFRNFRGRRPFQRFNQPFARKRFDIMSDDLDSFFVQPRQRFNRYGFQQNFNFRRRARGAGKVGFRSRGGATAGQGQIRRPARFSQEDLDKELDEYMAKTKTQLDTELESYMADANVVA